METENNFIQNEVPELMIEHFERKEIWSPVYEDIAENYSKLAEIWNKDQKARNFIKHLISKFLPINNWNRCFNLPEGESMTCSLSGKKLTGIKNCSEYLSKIFIYKTIMESKKFIQKVDYEYTEEELSQLNEARNNIPEEIKAGRVAYLSDKSDRKLSQESILALQYFAMNMFYLPEISNCLGVKRKNNQVEPETVKNEVPKSTYKLLDNVPESITEKLNKLKEQLEQKPIIEIEGKIDIEKLKEII